MAGGVSLGAAPANTNFPGGFSNGVTIREMPVVNAYPGKVFWLNNNNPTASDANRGTFERPFATLAGVMAAATANTWRAPLAGRGDLIMIGAGHAERISSATALTLSISGLQMVGLGCGGLRPTFTLDTANTSTINVSAANISFTNCLFVANFAAIASLFTLTAANDFRLDGCEFRDTTSILNFASIVTTDTVTNDASGLTILNSLWNGLGATANTTMVNMKGTNFRLFVQGNYMTHAATTQAGGMIIATGKVITGMQWIGNTHIFVGVDSTVGEVVSTNGTTNSGVFQSNNTYSLATTTVNMCTASSGFKYFSNLHIATADKSGYLIPVTGP